MAECRECGAIVAPSENFCGNCGTQNPPASAELKTVSATLDQLAITQSEDEPSVVEQATEEPPIEEPPILESASEALAGAAATEESTSAEAPAEEPIVAEAVL